MARLNLCFLILSVIIVGAFYPLCTLGFPFLLEKTIKMDRFLGRCPEHMNVPLYFKDVRFSNVRRMYYIATKIVATRDIPDQLKLVLKLERCRSKEALDSCEPYQDVNVKNICDLVNANFQPWTPMIKNMHPPLGCPIKKGTYTCTNGTFDGTALTALPVEGWYWKVKALVTENTGDKNRLVMCVYVEGQIVNV